MQVDAVIGVCNRLQMQTHVQIVQESIVEDDTHPSEENLSKNRKLISTHTVCRVHDFFPVW